MEWSCKIFNIWAQRSIRPAWFLQTVVCFVQHWRARSHVSDKFPPVLSYTEGAGWPWCVTEPASMIMVIPTLTLQCPTPKSALPGWSPAHFLYNNPPTRSLADNNTDDDVVLLLAHCSPIEGPCEWVSPLSVCGPLSSPATWSQSRRAVFVRDLFGEGATAISPLSTGFHVGG